MVNRMSGRLKFLFFMLTFVLLLSGVTSGEAMLDRLICKNSYREIGMSWHIHKKKNQPYVRLREIIVFPLVDRKVWFLLCSRVTHPKITVDLECCG